MCCPGCLAVASLINDSDLAAFYRQRTAYNQRPPEQPFDYSDQYCIYDDPDLAAAFTRTGQDGSLQAHILLGGLSCAACTWLIEHALMRLPGIHSAVVNLEQARLDVELDTTQLPLSEVFARVEALGYQARPFYRDSQQQQLREEYRRDLRRLGVAGFGMMQVGMFAVALHAGDIQGIAPAYQSLMRGFSLVVASFVVLYAARPFFSSAWRHLRQGALVMDLPVALAIGLAWLASAWATISGGGQVYFDSVVMFTFFLLLGRFLEARARRHRARPQVDIQETLPDAVTVWRDEAWLKAPRFSVAIGERVTVSAGDIVPVDARVEKGLSAVREDSFSGEHLPRPVSPGDTVFAGTINVEGPLECRVQCEDKHTRFAALQRSVEFARGEKPRLARLADRIAARFVAAILLIASATALAWSQIDPQQAFWITLSVLVVSCPCALALATPAALTSANSALRRRGILVKGADALESLSHCTHLIFDKTGTLTEGNLEIEEVVAIADSDREQLLALAAGLQRHSSHPVSQAFNNIPSDCLFDEVEYQAGAGLSASLNGVAYRMGSELFCRDMNTQLEPPPDSPLYWVALVSEQQALAWIGLNDRVRSEAGEVLSEAAAAGLEIELLSGDSSLAGRQLAQALNIERASFGLRPEQKMERVRALQRDGAVVAMVGDGLNDAPVLSVADASFAVPGATDLARTEADFIILSGDLRAIINSWRLSMRCRKIIWQNFAWALGYNLCAIPLAVTGFIPPWAAAIGMSASSLLVVLNSLRLNSARAA
jgi:Cu2+-exporting ATPase